MTKSAQYLEKFKEQESCTTFAPASFENIEKTSTFLSTNNACPLPLEYINFLKTTDGLIFNGIELFGAQEHFRPQKHYTFPHLAALNAPYSEYKFFQRKVILGRLSESFLIFDCKDGFYAVVDRMRLRSRFECKTFAELLHYLSRYIPASNT